MYTLYTREREQTVLADKTKMERK